MADPITLESPAPTERRTISKFQVEKAQQNINHVKSVYVIS